MINGVDHTIQGAGQIGRNTLSLQNGGTVNATQTNSLLIDLSGGLADNSNTGTMGASNGGTLRLFATEIDNTGGTIQALDNSLVELESTLGTTQNQVAHVRGGTLHTEGTGVIRGVSNDVRLEDLTIDMGSRYEVSNGTQTKVLGTIDNDGTLAVASTGGGTTLTLSTEIVTFESYGAGGEILLQGNGTDALTRGRIRRQTTGVDAPGQTTLINEVGHTIRGAGDVGVNTFFLDNRGLIDADGQGNGLKLTIDLLGDETDNTNSGTMQASNGGILEIIATKITNSSNTIQALDGSLVTLSGGGGATRIVGGTLATAGSGIIRTILVAPATSGSIRSSSTIAG